MSVTHRPDTGRRRRLLTAGLVATALGLVPVVVAAGATATSGDTSFAARTATQAETAEGKPKGQQPIKLDLLAINDFHGALEVPSGSGGRINTTPAGGAGHLATHLDRLRAQSAKDGNHTVTVAAGDLIGATPLLSAAFHDEPSIEAMNQVGLEIAAVGNHEFDEGYRELLRLQEGGCLDDGDGRDNQNSCPDPSRPFTGADFTYLGANVKYAGTDETVFPAYEIKKYDRAKVAFIGMTLEDTPNIVTRAGVEGLTFTDEVETVNALVPELRAQGVRSIVVLVHEGGVPSDPSQYNGCAGVTGPGVDIARQLHPDVDVVVTGHTHQAYKCSFPDPAGNERLVTSASSNGRIATSISLQIDPNTKDVIRPEATATNHIVTNADGTPARADVLDLIARYKALVAPIAERVLGQVAPVETANSVSRTPEANGADSPLGNLIADAQRSDESTVPAGGTAPVIALMNPGGIRADLIENAAGNVTYGAAFSAQPFNNYLVSLDLTGQQLLAVLNEQWNGRNEATGMKVLQVSGLSYTWDRSDAALVGANAVVADSVRVDLDRDGVAEAPLDPARTYRVVVNSFLADGGDGFATLGTATGKFYGGLDIDALADYLEVNAPYVPTATDRISAVD